MKECIRRVIVAGALVPALLVGGILPAAATPVAKNKQEWEMYGRVFLEPTRSVDFIQFDDEFAPGMKLLEKLYPRYVEFTTVRDELEDKNAVSVGGDGVPSWDKRDTGDGLPLHMAIVTDESVPDRNKGYVFLTNAHAAEPCGREGGLRFLEDLLIWRDTDPGHRLDDATGLTGKTHKVTVKELLKRTKIYFVNVTPDGWAAGDTPGLYGQSNGAGYNSNRIVYHDGWVFPDEARLRRNGYSTLTQPEGAAIVKYFMQVRRNELHGREFGAAADMHGPLPAGAVLLHDQGNDPAKLERIHDFAERIAQKMEAVLGSYVTPQGAQAYEQVMGEAGTVRDQVLRQYGEHVGPVTEKALFLTLEWAEYASIWEHLDYTVTGTWGGWAAGATGLGADSISYEVDCAAYAPWDGARMKVFVENIQAILEATVVHAAVKDRIAPKRRDLGGKLGFYEPGHRVTDADGNPSPPPRGPRNPIWGRVRQVPYDVSNTDYFRDLDEIVSSPIEEVRAPRLRSSLDDFDTFVVADDTVPDVQALKNFAHKGGNLVLTDSALRMLPGLLGVPAKAIAKGYAYVGYSDLNRDHPMTKGLWKRARQMYDPVGIGYPLLMERDQYWPCNDVNGECEKSPTKNSSSIWSIDREVWEDKGGETVATADPPESRKGGAEGFETNKTTIGLLEVGKGRIAIFGALLPRPTERYSHWFGLDPYTVTIPGQQLLLRALKT